MLLKLTKKHLLFISFVSFLYCSSLSGQNQTNNMGKDFWFTMLENTSPNTLKISFAISNKSYPNSITIRCGTLTLPITIYRKDTVINFPEPPINIPAAIQFINKSIHISSIYDISVYAMNNSGASTDIATIIPSKNIPFNPVYYVNTYRGDNGSNSSEFSIVAIDDSCYINILPSADTKVFNQKDTLITRLMRKGELYWLQSQDTQSFAGTKIWNSKGCKRFAVFEGSQCSRVLKDVSCSGCDHLFNQTRPLQIQGKEYTTIPFKNINNGFVVQIVATENNTSLFIDGIFIKTMYEREVFLYNNKTNLPNCITSDKKISVVQMMKSGNCNGGVNGIGNPSLMTVMPDEQLTLNVQFSCPTTNNLSFSPAEFYIGLTCPKENLKSIYINNKLIDTTKFTISCGKAVGSIPIISTAAYAIESTMGFNAYLYANGNDESYATELGGGYENSRTKLVMDPSESNTCDTFHTFKFRATSDSLASYLWNFGDGTTKVGDSVSKIYNRKGVFKVQLITKYTYQNGCPADSSDKTLTVYDKPYFTLGKDTMLCKGNFYTLSPFTTPKAKYLWSNNTTGKTYTTGNAGPVFLTVTDSNNCTFTDSIRLQFINCDTNTIRIPNVFTPGTIDGLNDYLETEFTGFDKLDGLIYSRWGEVVYKFTFPENEYWNGGLGNNSSIPCPSGTYYYIYNFSNSTTNLTKQVNGVVQLIR